MIKGLIKEILDASGQENKHINNLIYTSIRYIYVSNKSLKKYILTF